MRKLSFLALFLVAAHGLFAQLKQAKVVQLSGFAVTADSLMAVPYTHISIEEKRVVTAGPDGSFSFPALLGDTVYFTCIGYRPVMYIVPKTLESDKYSIVQLMTKSEYYLPATVIYPWGDRENFKDYFLHVHLPKDQIEIAKRNLNNERLRELGMKLEHDGDEATEASLRNQAAPYYYYGQTPPQNIFNPLAWADFIQAWKRGDFKAGKPVKVSDGDNNTNYEDIYNGTNGNH